MNTHGRPLGTDMLPRRLGLPVCFVFERAHAGRRGTPQTAPDSRPTLLPYSGAGYVRSPAETVTHAIGAPLPTELWRFGHLVRGLKGEDNSPGTRTTRQLGPVGSGARLVDR